MGTPVRRRGRAGDWVHPAGQETSGRTRYHTAKRAQTEKLPQHTNSPGIQTPSERRPRKEADTMGRNQQSSSTRGVDHKTKDQEHDKQNASTGSLDSQWRTDHRGVPAISRLRYGGD
eukprot:gene20019-biopygen16092